MAMPPSDKKQKRITIPVSTDIDTVREHIKKNTGITMSYIQIIHYLIHFYMKHCNEPKTQWATPKKE